MKITKFFALLCAAATFVACNDNESKEGEIPGPQVTGNLFLEADVEMGEMGKPITFTVMQGEEGDDLVDVTAYCKIYDKDTFEEVNNPFIPTLDGVYKFYAIKGKTVSETISITVKEAIPTLAEDTNLESFDFKHRALIIDHTGTNCGWCPYTMKAFEVLETPDYRDLFCEAYAHTYNSNDNASSDDAYTVSAFCPVEGYPSLTGNFYTNISTMGGDYNATATNVMSFIDSVHKDKADIGISAAAVALSNKVSVQVELKSAKTQEYRIACWLLEDDIYSAQNGALQASHNTHNNAIRKITGANNNNITGDAIGTIEEGKTWKSDIIELGPLGKKWERENFEVMVIVTAPNDKGVFDVANVVICPINSNIGYDYN